MSYLGELRQNIRPLLAASLGTGTSMPLFAYTNSAFAPYLIKEFHWSRAQFALIGLTMLATLVFLPLIGRLTDRFGVRRIALVGTVLLPFFFVGYSQMQGSFLTYAILFTAVLIVSSMTSQLVYTRLIAERFERAQGLALTIVNCAPAVLAIGLVPLLNMTIEAVGWRTSYLLLGGLVLVCNIAAVLLSPRPLPRTVPLPGEAPRPAREDYAIILRSRVFWIIAGAMFLCALQTQLHASQMNVMLLDQGITAQMAATIVSIYAAGTVIGRIACGLALDRYSTPIVTCISLGMPAFGFFLLGTSFNGFGVIAFAMFLVGLAVGAENDLVSFLVSRYFKLRIFNSTLGLLFCASFLSSATGSIGVSISLRMYDSFVPFLFLLAGTITAGSLLFLLLPKSRDFEKIG